jgi:hypothetical protein
MCSAARAPVESTVAQGSFRGALSGYVSAPIAGLQHIHAALNTIGRWLAFPCVNSGNGARTNYLAWIALSWARYACIQAFPRFAVRPMAQIFNDRAQR